MTKTIVLLVVLCTLYSKECFSQNCIKEIEKLLQTLDEEFNDIEHYAPKEKLEAKKKFDEYKGDKITLWNANGPNIGEYKLTKNDTLDVFEIFYDNGRLRDKSFLKNGVLDGIRLSYYWNGVKQMEIPYQKGAVDGSVKFYFENGKIEKEIHYLKGVKEGNYIEYYFTDDSINNIKSIVPYKHNKVNGMAKLYSDKYENYNLKCLVLYENDEIKKCEDYAFSFFEKKNYKRYSVNIKKGLKKGDECFFFRNGSVKKRSVYKNGKLEIVTVFDLENNKISEVKCKDGKKNGVFKEVNDAGKISQIAEYKNDSLHGLQIEYFDNGEVKEITKYSNGLKVDTSKYFSRPGVIKFLSTFYPAGKINYFSEYTDKGIKQEETFFNEHGIAENKLVYDLVSHKVRQKEKLKDGREVEAIIYDSTGKAIWINNYYKGRCVGRCLFYSNGHKLFSEMIFDNDNNGITKYYTDSGKVYQIWYYIKNEQTSEQFFFEKFVIQDGSVIKKGIKE